MFVFAQTHPTRHHISIGLVAATFLPHIPAEHRAITPFDGHAALAR
ncbi:hypothetical protein DLM_1251 [Aquitalea magnusonii]|uniref:Uncharacterized protein n=1 Tax=Aquitalea magnusonii TaxID=332411 RepID=A0A3G9GBN8_9NEIS|nr:hypothetical protein DLM_1251 [Aquitalea magnusonii]